MALEKKQTTFISFPSTLKKKGSSLLCEMFWREYSGNSSIRPIPISSQIIYSNNILFAFHTLKHLNLFISICNNYLPWFSVSSPQLMTICSESIQTYENAEKMDSWPGSKTAALWVMWLKLGHLATYAHLQPQGHCNPFTYLPPRLCHFGPLEPYVLLPQFLLATLLFPLLMRHAQPSPSC